MAGEQTETPTTQTETPATTETATGTTTPATEGRKTALDFVEQRMSEAEGNQEAPAEDGVKKDHPKQTVQERISHYSNKAKTAEAERDALKAEKESIVTQYEDRIAKLERMVQSGDLTRAQADHAADAAQEDAETALDDLDSDDDLRPYADRIRHAIDRRVEAAVKPFKDQAERAASVKWFDTKVSNYNAAADNPDYADLFGDDTVDFTSPTGEVVKLKRFKPEYEKEASRLMEFADVTTKEGLELIMERLMSPVRGTKLKEAEAGKVQRLKSSGVEGSGNSNAPVATKTRTIEEIVAARMKEFSGRG